MKRGILFAAVAVTACLCASLAIPRGHGAARPAVISELNVAVPMRDGVVLRADILRPDTPGPFPVLVYRTPYGKTPAQTSYTTFRHAVERGYAVVIQDVRGRYASDGEFNAYWNEGRDGYDTIEWAARQTWSNGNVGTFGLSYPGAVQWLAAVEHPPHLKAMVPAMTFSTPRYFFYSAGTFDLSWPEWFLVNIAPDIREKKGMAGPRTHKDARTAYEADESRIVGYVPLSGLPDLKDIAPSYYEWLKHPPTDAWWDWAEIRGKYDKVTAAVLNLSGWYDEDYGPEGATTNFNGLLAARKAEADPRTALILGPWVHGVDSTQKSKAGEREFGADAAINYDEVVLGWLDLYLKNDTTDWHQQKRVRYFVMGENHWHDADTWPPPAHNVPYFLSGAPEGATRGALGPNRVRGAATSTLASDPSHPFTDPYGNTYGGHDYKKIQRGGGKDSAIFETAAFEADTDVAGRITADIYMSCDCPDADLWVRLYDVAPDGTSYNLMGPGLDVMRASLSANPSVRKLLDPGKPYRITIPNLPTGNRFLAGHKLRVQISGEFSPHFSRNNHTGDWESTSATMKPATITILHDAAHPSRLLLPITNWIAPPNRGVGGKPVQRRDIPQ